MENKETIVRETHYKYDENEKLTSMTVNETITNPGSSCSCEEGELMTGQIEFTKDGPDFADVALALAGIGLCLTAVVSIFKRN